MTDFNKAADICVDEFRSFSPLLSFDSYVESKTFVICSESGDRPVVE